MGVTLEYAGIYGTRPKHTFSNKSQKNLENE